jgi:predicted nucleotidyltransferase component of viral defense system
MEDFVLNWNQKKILKNIPFLKKYGIYLAGGTALALHFGHRISRDLDFYTSKHFNPKIIYKRFREIFKEEKLSKETIAEDTLKFKINITDLSFFRYPYPLIRPLIPYQSVDLASPEDIIAMKMEAIITRGLKRDFVDIYFAIKKYGVKEILKFFKEKYPEAFNEYNCITALTYFEDAEKSEQGRKRIYIYSGISWSKIKKYITDEIKKYQLSLIKK